MKLLAAILALSLTGCATLGGAPEDIKIPVAVACKTPDPNIPTYRFSPPYDNVFDAVRDLMGDREAALAYENELRAALKSCK